MSTQVLPKKRAHPGGPSSRVSSIHDISQRGRVLSGRGRSSRVPSSGRHVSRGDLFIAREDEPEDPIHFNENKHTILTNFEEWIKLSTDNKITSKNSWQFALIDYFHDLNVIKDGESINFQRASATLDGCVKIYLSRVESAALETGKLLSGLATKNGHEEFNNAEDDDADENNDDADNSQAEGDDGKRKRKINRVLESTLVPFESIQIKKLDQELSIDPLLKKALAEFDEGGAKSLLLNTLSIDAAGRVVFDATTTENSNGLEDEENESEEKELADVDMDRPDIDIDRLHTFVYNTPEELDDLVICPSLQNLKSTLMDVNKAKSLLGEVNGKFSAQDFNPETHGSTPLATPYFPDYGNDFGDDDAGGDPFMDDYNDGGDNEGQSVENFSHLFREPEDNADVVTTKVLDNDLMAYFDERMKSNWRGPEHWRVAAIKTSKKLHEPTTAGHNAPAATAEPSAPGKRSRKALTVVDFLSNDDDDDEDLLFEQPKTASQIVKRDEDRTSANLHKLPEDIQFNSERLLNLFIKARKSILHFSKREQAPDENSGVKPLTDENFFANQYEEEEEERRQQEKLAASFHQAELEDYDNDDFGGIDFNDALETYGTNDNEVKPEGAAGETQLITGGRKVRPEYVNFSRIAKRVDVKLLKDNLWRSIKPEPAEEKEKVPEEDHTPKEKQTKQFGDVITSIGQMYDDSARKDLSTSFCFICLLHLANEHGLDIVTNSTHDDLTITGF